MVSRLLNSGHRGKRNSLKIYLKSMARIGRLFVSWSRRESRDKCGIMRIDSSRCSSMPMIKNWLKSLNKSRQFGESAIWSAGVGTRQSSNTWRRLCWSMVLIMTNWSFLLDHGSKLCKRFVNTGEARWAVLKCRLRYGNATPIFGKTRSGKH